MVICICKLDLLILFFFLNIYYIAKKEIYKQSFIGRASKDMFDLVYLVNEAINLMFQPVLNVFFYKNQNRYFIAIKNGGCNLRIHKYLQKHENIKSGKWGILVSIVYFMRSYFMYSPTIVSRKNFLEACPNLSICYFKDVIKILIKETYLLHDKKIYDCLQLCA